MPVHYLDSEAVPVNIASDLHFAAGATSEGAAKLIFSVERDWHLLKLEFDRMWYLRSFKLVENPFAFKQAPLWMISDIIQIYA